MLGKVKRGKCCAERDFSGYSGKFKLKMQKIGEREKMLVRITKKGGKIIIVLNNSYLKILNFFKQFVSAYIISHIFICKIKVSNLPCPNGEANIFRFI